jgi:dTDP-3-amino-3,4,6-trideoxy-alpha-D-glucose transaminase
VKVLANEFVRQWADLGPDALRVFDAVGKSGWYVLGNEVREFESALAAYWGPPHAIGVANGLDAIEIGLRILGCEPGDRVLTTPVSAFATTLAILKTGAIPVFADTNRWGAVDLDACCEILRRRPEIRYFVPVHLYGNPLNMTWLRQMRSEFGHLRIVEDCAQSIGASSPSGEATGSVGHLAAVSFYPTKNLGAMGDGGAILTADPEIDRLARAYRDYGQTAKYRHDLIGYNSRLDEVQAAFLHRVCLPRLERWTQRRRDIADRYRAAIRHESVTLFPFTPGSCHHLFPVLVPPHLRDGFLRYLQETGVGAGIHYPISIPDQEALAGIPFEGDCANAKLLCISEASLPIHPYLTDEEADFVAETVNNWPV